MLQSDHQSGKKNKNGAAYNIISLRYDNSPEGQYLKERDDDAKVRALMRSKNIDVRSNCGYNPLNGSERRSVEVPQHRVYNPDSLSSVGASIIGSGFAGKPVRKELMMPSDRSIHSQNTF